MINKKSIKKLEFDQIIKSYNNYCKTIYGKNKLSEIDFFYNKEDLEFELTLLQEIVEYIQRGFSFPLSGFPEINDDVIILQKGLTLNLESSFNVYRFIINSNLLINSIKKITSPLFNSRFKIEYSFEKEVEEIKQFFNDDGQIPDDATANLFNIRKKIRKTQNEFMNIISSIANKYKEFLVSENYILKEDRYLLPVKLSKKNNVNGIFFGFSDSGKTMLIEPIEIVELNNLLYQLRAEEQQEIARILFKISEIYRNNIEKIIKFIDIVGNLDFLNAKATIAFEKGYGKPEINDKNKFILNQFYHPLLEKPIKNNIEFGEEKQFIVITGPNTGGKSVTLKAIGIIQMLFQSGFFVPASAGSSLPLVEDILIDIGDLQSIEQSLSTFSSHILELKEIVEKASDKTLILIDELGTATSPIEGEALAISILDSLINKKSYGIITSHFDRVKKYAIENPNVTIASMCFDEELMVPKYILMLDLPGYSYAFEIASRLGISSDIIEKAKKIARIDQDNYNISKHLSNLVLEYKEKLTEIEKKEIEFLNKEEEIKRLKSIYSKNAKEIEKEIIKDINEKILEMKKEIERQIYEIKTTGYSKEKSKDVINIIEKKKEEIFTSFQKYDNLDIREEIKEIENLKIGDTVETGIFGKKGKIINIEKDKAKIQAESFIFEVPLNQIIKIKNNLSKKNNLTSTYIPSKNIPSTIDIRGKTIEEAKLELETYLNEVINSGYEKIYIIHGKGTGKLSNFVHQYLTEKKKIIDSFNYASLSEGGTGCTIAILKK